MSCYTEKMNAENPKHIPLKHMGLAGVRISVGVPSDKERELAEKLLAPLRRQMGLDPELPSLTTRIRRKFSK